MIASVIEAEAEKLIRLIAFAEAGRTAETTKPLRHSAKR